MNTPETTPPSIPTNPATAPTDDPLTTFNKHRAHIESSASAKYDRQDFEPEDEQTILVTVKIYDPWESLRSAGPVFRQEDPMRKQPAQIVTDNRSPVVQGINQSATGILTTAALAPSTHSGAQLLAAKKGGWGVSARAVLPTFGCVQAIEEGGGRTLSNAPRGMEVSASSIPIGGLTRGEVSEIAAALPFARQPLNFDPPSFSLRRGWRKPIGRRWRGAGRNAQPLNSASPARPYL